MSGERHPSRRPAIVAEPPGVGAGSTSVAWFHCFSGISGDMALGALVDAGADIAEVRTLCERLPIAGWALEAEEVMRCGIGGTKVHVHLAEDDSVVRTAAHVQALVEEARLPDRVRTRALRTFQALAEVEGRLHRRPPQQVHFHEVGGVDSIIDVVGTCCALEVLDIDELSSSPVANGIGTVRSAHGLMPNPPPAVTELLVGAPTYGLDVPLELTTPTGAALLAANVAGWGPLPDMIVERVGFGAGTAELQDRPNLAQVVIGAGVADLAEGPQAMELAVNVDDATGEQLAEAVASLLDAGSHDAWVTPVLMKKGRPGHVVSALCDPALAAQVRDTLVRSTGSLGVRGRAVQRWPMARTDVEVMVDGMPVRIKVGAGRVKVEHDDASRVARRTGRSLREVTSLAEERWRHRHDQGLVSVPYPDPSPAEPDDHDHPHMHGHDHGNRPDQDHDHDPGGGSPA